MRPVAPGVCLCPSRPFRLLVIRPVAHLFPVVGPGHLALGRGALHAGWRGPSGGRPHAGTQAPGLVEGGAEGGLVLGEGLHGVGVVVVGWGRSIDRGPAVLRRGARRRVAHVGRQLAHDVAWRCVDGGWGRGHGGRGLVVNHVRRA